jgi:putative ABC transport system permease protein
MFDLEQALTEWKKTMRRKQAFEDGDIADLEAYLRDKVDHLKSAGLGEEVAFLEASREFDRSRGLDSDFLRARSRAASPSFSFFSIFHIPALVAGYFRVAFRHFKHKKLYSLVNVSGLAAGLACCMVILLFVAAESGYDRYHPDFDRLYRVLEYRKVPAGEFCSANVSAMVAVVLKAEYPEVEEAARVFPASNVIVRNGEKRSFEDRVYYTETSLFRILSVPFLRGDAGTALGSVNSIVLTQSLARKYFGAEDPMGKTLTIKDPVISRIDNADRTIDYLVTGIVADPPSNTHFPYGILLPLAQFSNPYVLKDWHASMTRTYLKLRAGVVAREFEQRIERMAYDYVGKDLAAWGQTRRYFLQPVTDIHFQRDFKGLPIRGELEPPGSRDDLYVYSALAFLILLIGCMNFINLSNARGVHRIKEVALRKVIGARRGQLILQFLSESITVTVFAALCAILLVKGLLPLFNQFAETTLTASGLLRPRILGAILGLVVVVGVFSGLYPAFVLTSFRPNQIFRGSVAAVRGSFALKVLVVGQFAISIFLASGSITVAEQLAHMRGGQLGFDMGFKYVINMRNARQAQQQVETLKTEFLRNPGILGVTASSSVPGRPLKSGYLKWSDDKLDKPLPLTCLSCDEDFIPSYKIAMAAGRAFDARRNDEGEALLINEAAVRLLGYGSAAEALGDRLYGSFFQRSRTIVGVVRDFHFEGLRQGIEPLYLVFSPEQSSMITLTLAPRNIQETFRFIEAKWSELVAAVPFDGFFLEEDFGRVYRKDAQVGKLLGILTAMGLVVACLGLLGLASFLSQHRTKEIGIRKVMGASVSSLVELLSRQFVVLVVLANVIAVPAALIASRRWLRDFSFRIEPGWQIFLMAGAITLFCALIPILSQALRTAGGDPVKSLRYE